MSWLDGYALDEPFHTGATSRLYRGTRVSDQLAVVVKTTVASAASLSDQRRLVRQHDLATQLPDGIFVPTVALEYAGTRAALVMTNGGLSLDVPRHERDGWRVADFLHVAAGVARCLDRLHNAGGDGYLHGDLRPQSIVWMGGDHAPLLCDLDHVRPIDRERGVVTGARVEGDFAYIAPELTGRLRLPVDARSDLYSLGVTLFELLTGRRPFESDDAIELIRSHLARRPPEILSLRPDVPEQVAAIVHRLLQKRPDDRYLTARGLLHDLERCQRQHAATGDVTPFQLGALDASSRFIVADQFYGRSAELDTLAARIDQAVYGAAQLVLIAGEAGAGKSTLVDEARRALVARHARAVFASGKFESGRHGTPYSALLDALGEVIRHVLGLPESDFARRKAELTVVVGPLGQLLVDVLPELERILGPQRPVPRVGPAETQARFHELFLSFIASLGTLEQPLVLFLDDLHEADAASLTLLTALIGEERSEHLCLLGTYRSEEVDTAHPLMLAVTAIREHRTVPVVELGPLSLDSVAGLVSDTLRCAPGEVTSLAEEAHRRTGGNPFFLGQYLLTLQHDGVIAFDEQALRWRWDEARIERSVYSRNVIEVVLARIERLDPEVGEVLRLAACVGSEFSLATVGAAADGRIAPPQLELRLAEAGEAGLVQRLYGQAGDTEEAVPAEARYRFIHDRVREAAYSLVPPDGLAAIHLRIGRLLKADLREDDRGEALFDLVHHLGLGAPLVEALDERLEIVDLCRRAAARATASNAWSVAMSRLTRAFELLGDDPWTHHARLAVAIRAEYARAAALLPDYEAMDKAAADVIERTDDLELMVDMHELRLFELYARDRLTEVLDVGHNALATLGVKLPRHPSTAQVLAAIGRTTWRMRNRSPNDLFDLPLCDDPRRRGVVRLLIPMSNAAVAVEPNMYAVMVAYNLRVALDVGLTEFDGATIGAWGLLRLIAFKDTEAANEYGRFILGLHERRQQLWGRAAADLLLQGVFLVHSRPLRGLTPGLRELFREAIVQGDLETAGTVACTISFNQLLLGDPLAPLQAEAEQFRLWQEQHGQLRYWHYVALVELVAANLRDGGDEPTVIRGLGLDAERRSKEALAEGDNHVVTAMAIGKALLCQVFGDLDGGLAAVRVCMAHPDGLLPYAGGPLMQSLIGLAHAAHAERSQGLARWKALRVLDKATAWLRSRVEAVPANVAHRVALLEAERLRIDGERAMAAARYDDAIRLAAAEQYLHELAIANELAGRFYLQDGRSRIARLYLRDAHAAYLEWGAAAKAGQMVLEYPDMGLEAGDNSAAEGGPVALDAMDVDALTRATSAISGEFRPDRLAPRVLEILMSTAGASRAVLVLSDADHDGQPLVVAVADEDLGASAVTPKPLDEGQGIARGLAYLVIRSGEAVLLGDAAMRGDFTGDPYVRHAQPRSVLCMPIRGRGAVLGCVYLENNLIEDAFPAERLGFLELLAGQAGVAIDNAALYQALERKVEDRTRELSAARRIAEDAKERSERLLRNILPEAIADELRAKGTAQPVSFDAVTVMFTDFVGFTELAGQMSPEQIVGELDVCFTAFDEIIDRYRLEKLKTLGDGYMCAGGVPVANGTHAVDSVLAAFEIQRFMAARRAEKEASGQAYWGVRIGIHTGPLVAGVIGRRKFVYDVWGDAVNTASRMESRGADMRVNVSRATRDRVAEFFELSSRGMVTVKGKGEVEMFFVEDIRPELRDGDPGGPPNAAFAALRDEAGRRYEQAGA